MKHRLKYQLISYYVVVCAVIVMAVLVYLLYQQRNFSLNSARDELIAYNESVYSRYLSGEKFESMELPGKLRVTVLDSAFWVLYDSSDSDLIYQDNHVSRDEIVKAVANGDGTALRFSPTLNMECLYYVKKYGNLYIRTSQPYRYEKIAIIESNDGLLYIVFILIIVLVFVFFEMSRRLTKPIKVFNEFFEAVKVGKKDFSSITFPQDEYGDIGRKIVSTYDQLEKIKDFKQQVTHNISHELKTPLTGVRGYLETILQDEDMPPQLVRKFVKRAYKQSLRLSELVEDVAVLNKLDEQSKYYTIEEVNISTCIKEIEEELAVKLEKNNIVINSYISSTLNISGNYNLIYSLFKNLIDNTIEHAGEGVSISIRAGIDQRSGSTNYGINFIYQDNGVGIPDSAIDKLFDRFFRIEDGRTRDSGGSGLGLAIVKNAVVFHKGNITVENAPEGGIIFRFNLMSL